MFYIFKFKTTVLEALTAFREILRKGFNIQHRHSNILLKVCRCKYSSYFKVSM